MRLSKIVPLLVAGLAIAVLVVVLKPDRTPKGESDPAPPPTASAAAPSPTPSTSMSPSASSTPSRSSGTPATGPGYVGSDDAKRRAAPVIDAFARAYPRTGDGRRAWLAGLTPYTTGQVDAALRRTDLDSIPDGHYEGFEVLRYDGGQVAAEVSYSEGWALVLYVAVTPTTDPLVAAYDRLVE